MPEGFRHEALLYAGEDEFLDGTVPFIRGGVEGGEPTLVVVDAPKIEALRTALGDAAEHVHFADMAEVGANPARIIPAWREFVDRREMPARPLRGIGEPIGPDREEAALAECHQHESLLNLAFAETPRFWLLCPYDTKALDDSVLEEARRNHPYLARDGQREESPDYADPQASAPFADPLPPAPPGAQELRFDGASLNSVRRAVARQATEAGLYGYRADDLVLAVTEVATNSIRHGGGEGTLQVWNGGASLVCEVRDNGRIDAPLAGRERPGPDQVGGSGLWLVNQLCDLVQLRSGASGSVVRLHMRVR